MANEISESLNDHTSSDLIQTNYLLDEQVEKKNAKKYAESEVRLIEVLEDVCERILRYNVHAEREGSLRYAKGESQTMKSLKELRNRGVKVELGIPDDLWDVPSAEITQLKKYCDQMIELYEEDIETWYLEDKMKTPLIKFLCEERMLLGHDQNCLNEMWDAAKEKKKQEKYEKEANKEL